MECLDGVVWPACTCGGDAQAVCAAAAAVGVHVVVVWCCIWLNVLVSRMWLTHGVQLLGWFKLLTRMMVMAMAWA